MLVLCLITLFSLFVGLAAAGLKGVSGGTLDKCIAYGAGAFAVTEGLMVSVVMFLFA